MEKVMKMALFIRACARDSLYLEQCLKSINRFAEGFHEIIIVCPEVDQVMISKVASPYSILVRTYPCGPTVKDRLMGAQGIVCCADVFCCADTLTSDKSELICFMDCDCVFTEKVTPSDYLKGNKPILLIEPYSRLTNEKCWQDITENVIGLPTDYYFVRRMPIVHYAFMIRLFREWFIPLKNNLTPKSVNTFLKWVENTPKLVESGLNGLNTLGAFAYCSPAINERYEILDVSQTGYPPNKCHRFSARGKMDKPQWSVMPEKKGLVIPNKVMQAI